MEKVELDGKVLLWLVDEPLESELREYQTRDFDAPLHRCSVNFRISSHVVMLHFYGDFLTILESRSVYLSQTGNAKRLWVKWIK